MTDEPFTRRRKQSQNGTVVLSVTPAEGVSESGSASLVLIHPPDAEIGRRLVLTEKVLVVGRDASADVVLERDSLSRRHAELAPDADRGVWLVRDLGSTNGTFVNEHEVRASVTLRDGDQVRFGDLVFKCLIGASIEQQYHDGLYQLSVLDSLTGAHNRRYLADFLDRELASARRHQHPISIAMIDLDDFKSINDTHGHVAGDGVLKELVTRIRPRIRREDLFARYGGEEFAAVLTMTGADGAAIFAEAMRAIVARDPFEVEGASLGVTVSVGVATTQAEPAVDADALVHRADEALYEAKRQGKNRVVVAPPGPAADPAAVAAAAADAENTQRKAAAARPADAAGAPASEPDDGPLDW